MTQEQQKLYDKLLKKVNEYCLGYAAEDVIAAIDALVDTYESRLTEADGYATRYSEALELIKKKRVNVKVFLKYCNREDGLKLYNNQCCDWQEMESKELTKEEYELLKEILK